jgi:1-acyl-sn-glycerol-3-phosphate acyltransferase
LRPPDARRKAIAGLIGIKYFPDPVESSAIEPFNRGENAPAIRVLRAGAAFYARVYHRLRVLEPSQVPRHGPAILVCNHTSGLDPVLIQSACPRFIRWMMAREYFDLKALNWCFRTVGAIPVERSGRDTAATRAALRALEEGFALGVFPEGKIETTRDLLPFQQGIGLMALKTGAPVYPAYLDGKQRGREMLAAFALVSGATIAFGPPVDLSKLEHSRHGVEEATARIQAAVDRLRASHIDSR